MSKRNYVSNYDFAGDGGMHQLTLARYSIVGVKQGQDTSDGWLWGESRGRRGWFPVWAIDYQKEPSNANVMGSQVTPQSSLHTSGANFLQHQPAIMTESDIDASGFDTSANEIMGGHDPRKESTSSRQDDNPFNGPDSRTDRSSQSFCKSKGLFSRFRKSRIIPFVNQDKAKTPEWTPEPQILYEGKVIHDFSQPKKKRFFQR